MAAAQGGRGQPRSSIKMLPPLGYSAADYKAKAGKQASKKRMKSRGAGSGDGGATRRHRRGGGGGGDDNDGGGGDDADDDNDGGGGGAGSGDVVFDLTDM